eukprot:CAMPEP_0204499518 /NCGR_PEP_ID=MMETSP0471-20130131/95252_1 /ASSEMBLY_ACC=CAM_ASM_000602 /TAXON_ID=2969 /ORGANISM="Oxyrrhis marina" /LENGTH=197 /DNA_ID=CAMNT_0051504071 /DNA_START=259 /DNA_END=848 /DNA_ORIENTATION=-
MGAGAARPERVEYIQECGHSLYWKDFVCRPTPGTSSTADTRGQTSSSGSAGDPPGCSASSRSARAGTSSGSDNTSPDSYDDHRARGGRHGTTSPDSSDEQRAARPGRQGAKSPPTSAEPTRARGGWGIREGGEEVRPRPTRHPSDAVGAPRTPARPPPAAPKVDRVRAGISGPEHWSRVVRQPIPEEQEERGRQGRP